MQLKKVADLIGFTRTEFSVVVFLTAVFITGMAIKYYSHNSSQIPGTNFRYAAIDSLFLMDDSLSAKDSLIIKKDLDSQKNEVLELDSRKSGRWEKKTLPAPFSIDINRAAINDLMRLPGIGEKTAAKILQYRLDNGPFTSINGLLEVKGIGPVKLEKIRNFIFIK